MVVRGVMAALLMLGMVFIAGEARHLGSLKQPLVILRGCFEGLVALTFISALAHLPLADITAILQATPILLTLICAVLGIEKVGWRRWGAVVVGFAGMLLVVKPGESGFSVYTLLALLSATLVAVRELVTRRISPAVPTVVISLGTTTMVIFFGLAQGTSDWVPLKLDATIYLFCAAFVVSLGNIAIVSAYRRADVSVVSPFRYSVIIWAGLIGFFLFGDVPDVQAIVGTALIVASGLYTVHRERVRSRRLASTLPPNPDTAT